MKRFILTALLASYTGPLLAGPITHSPCTPYFRPLCSDLVYESDCKPIEQDCSCETVGNRMIAGAAPLGGFGALPLLGAVGLVALIDNDRGSNGRSILVPPKGPFKPTFPPGPPFNPPGPPPWVPAPPNKPETPLNIPIPEPSSIAIFSLIALGVTYNIHKQKPHETN